jgi:quercetin dioxygenase-like cupin family protein
MQVTTGTIEVSAGEPHQYTGSVMVETIAVPSGSAELLMQHVHLAPRARTVWSSSPHGGMITVVDGVGLCQRRGGPPAVVRPGDRIVFEPGEEHWYGAAPDRFLTCLLAVARESAAQVDCGRPVPDETYAAACSDSRVE